MNIIENSRIFFTKKMNSINFFIDSTNLNSYILISLPVTIEKQPFGFQLLFDLNSDEYDSNSNFGKGIFLSNKLLFEDDIKENQSFYTTNLLGKKKCFQICDSNNNSFVCHATGEQLIVGSSLLLFINKEGTRVTYNKKTGQVKKFTSNTNGCYELKSSTNALFRYANDNCSVEFISTTSDKKITQIVFKQITDKINRTNYQVYLTYDANNYLKSIEYKENDITIEKYSFSKSETTFIVKDEMKKSAIIETNYGTYKEIETYINGIFISAQTINLEGKRTILTNKEGRKTEYCYNINNQLEYEINENGWATRHYFDKWNREIETSRTLQIFSHKTLRENLLENGNFLSGSLKYDLDGNATLLDVLTTSSILDGKFVGKWCKITPLSEKSTANISQTITKSGHKGDPFTAVLLGYKNDTSGLMVTLKIYFYDELNQCIGNYYKSGAAVQGKLTFFTLSVEAPGEFSKIKVAVSFSKNQNFYMKELGLYEIGVGKRITYGYHGAVRKVQTGNEEVRTTMDQNNRLLSLTSSSFSGDLIEEYNDKNQPTKSVDIFGNTTEMEYDEDGELISQRIQCVNVYSVSKRTISYNYGTITTKTTTEIDTRDQTSVEVIEINSNSLRSYLDPLSKKEEYGYNAYHDLIKVKESKDGTTLREQNITYNANRQIQKVVSGNGSQIEFEYNNYGLPEYVYVDDTNTQVELYAYENDGVVSKPKTGRISYKIYGDNDYIESYTYNENGQLLYVDGDKDGDIRTQREYKFTYDGKERLTHVYGTNNKLIKVYSYTPEDDISKIQIIQGETIDIIRKENKEGYIVSRMTPNGEHSFEYKSQYDEASKRSPGAIINGVFQEFYSCFFIEKDPNSEKYSTQLRKENEDGSMSNILNNGGLSDYIEIQKKGRIPYYLVENNGNEILSYYLENKTDSIYVGCLYHFLENQDDDATNYRIIFGIRINDSDLITLEKKGESLCLFKHNPLSSTLICNISSKLLKKEWNYLGVKLKKEETNTIISIIVNKNITSYTYNESISLSENFSVSYAEQGSTLSVLYRAYGWYTNLMVANTDFSLEDICRYIDGLYHNLLEVEKEGSTWKQEAVQTKHTVLGIKETSGLTNWDYFPLSGSVTSVKGNRDVKLTPKEEYYKANNSYYSYDETLRQEVFDAGKCILCKTIDFPFESGKANILFDFKVLESETTDNFNIFDTEGLKIFVEKDEANSKQYYVCYTFGSSNKITTSIKITKGTWNKFQLGLSRENGMIRMYLIINNSHFANYQSNSLYSKLNMTPAKNTNCLLANFLYGEGEYSKYESLLKRIRETTETDRLGRTLSTEIEDNGSVVLKKTYTYEDRTVTENGSTETRTSGIISKEVDSYGDNEVTNVYTFDALGRMTSQTHGIAISGIFYTYDDRGFLQEENYSYRQRYVYDYDNNGNIKTVKYYKNPNIISPTTTTFTYGTLYKDRLERVGRDVLEYEETNPLYVKRIYNSSTQVEKMNFTWRGTRLAKLIVDGETDVQYEYNDDGTRLRKTIKKIENGTSTLVDQIIYSYVDGQLQSETHSKGYQLQYFYGLDGRLSFFIYRKDSVETRYYYRWDLLGITGIIDRDGNEVANYSYDAFGNIRSTHEDDSIGAINPMRYKGYYYDSETKMYYISCRYYYPNYRRFITPESIGNLDLKTIGGLNLYCYGTNIQKNNFSNINNENSSSNFINNGSNQKNNFSASWIVENATSICGYFLFIKDNSQLIKFSFLYSSFIHDDMLMNASSKFMYGKEMAKSIISWEPSATDYLFLAYDLTLDIYINFKNKKNTNQIITSAFLTIINAVALFVLERAILQLTLGICFTIASANVAIALGIIITILLISAIAYLLGRGKDWLIKKIN